MHRILASDCMAKNVDRGERGVEQTVPVITSQNNSAEAGQHKKSVGSRRPRGTNNASSSSLSPSKNKKVNKRKQRKQKQLLLTMKEKQTEDEEYWKKIKQSDDRKERREKMKLCFARNNVEMVSYELFVHVCPPPTTLLSLNSSHRRFHIHLFPLWFVIAASQERRHFD